MLEDFWDTLYKGGAVGLIAAWLDPELMLLSVWSFTFEFPPGFPVSSHFPKTFQEVGWLC